MRQIALSNKPLRGIPRRLRALERWASSFRNEFHPRSEHMERATHIGRSRCTRPWSKALKPGSKFRPSAFSNCSKPPATCPTLPTTHRVTTGSPACWCGHGFIRARSPSSMIETTIWVFSVKPTRLNQSGSVMFLPCTLQRISSSTGMT